MKIKPQEIGARISSFVKDQKMLRAQILLDEESRHLDKYCKISGNLDKDVYDKLRPAKKTIANYAKHENVSVEISNAKQFVDEYDMPIIDEMLAKSIDVSVLDLETGRALGRFIDKDVKSIHNDVKHGHYIVDFPHDGVQQTRITQYENEDNFLRYIYRNISDMVRKIRGNK